MAETEIDLTGLRMSAGEGRRLDPVARIDEIGLSDARYAADPAEPTTRVDVSRMLGGGWSLRLRFDTRIVGPCMRCLAPAGEDVEVDVREHEQKGTDDDQLDSPYVEGDTVTFGRWVNDSFVFAVPQRILCRPDCAGLCPTCGADLNEDPEHAHEAEPDPRWAALSGLTFDDEGRMVDGG